MSFKLKWRHPLFVPFGEAVLDSQYGINAPSSPAGSTPMLRMGNLQEGDVDVGNLVMVDLSPSERENYLLSKGDLLFNRTNSYDLVGKTSVFNLDGEFTFASYIVRFKVNPKTFSLTFLCYWFNNPASQRKLKLLATKGASQSNINPTNLKNRFLVPNIQLEQQNALASSLANWDQAIRSLQRLIGLAEKRNHALLSQFLGKETHHQTSDWATVRLGAIADFINGRGFKESEWTTEGLPIIRIQNLNGSLDFNFFDGPIQEKFIIDPGTLLFSWSGNRGTSFGPHIWSGPRGVLNQHIFKVIPREHHSRDFLYLVLKYATRVLENEAHGASGLVHVTKSRMENFEVNLPTNSLKLQSFTGLLMAANRELTLLRQLLDKIKKQKQGILLKLFSEGSS